MSVRRTAALALAAAVLLAGCQDEPEPEFDPTPTESPSKSEPTEEPEAETAKKFVRDWVETYNAFEASGDSSTYASLNKGCSTCNDIQETVEEAYDSGGFLKSDGWQILGTVDGTPPTLTATVEVSPSQYKASAGAGVERADGGRIIVEFRVREIAGAWKLTDLIQRPS